MNFDAGEPFVSASWWISVVVVGLVLNVLGYFIARYADRALGNLSGKWRLRTEKRERARQKRIEYFAARPERLLRQTMYGLYLAVRAENLITMCFISLFALIAARMTTALSDWLFVPAAALVALGTWVAIYLAMSVRWEMNLLHDAGDVGDETLGARSPNPMLTAPTDS